MIRGVTTKLEATSPAPLETAPAPLEMRPRLGLSRAQLARLLLQDPRRQAVLGVVGQHRHRGLQHHDRAEPEPDAASR